MKVRLPAASRQSFWSRCRVSHTSAIGYMKCEEYAVLNNIVETWGTAIWKNMASAVFQVRLMMWAKRGFFQPHICVRLNVRILLTLCGTWITSPWWIEIRDLKTTAAFSEFIEPYRTTELHCACSAPQEELLKKHKCLVIFLDVSVCGGSTGNHHMWKILLNSFLIVFNTFLSWRLSYLSLICL